MTAHVTAACSRLVWLCRCWSGCWQTAEGHQRHLLANMQQQTPTVGLWLTVCLPQGSSPLPHAHPLVKRVLCWPACRLLHNALNNTCVMLPARLNLCCRHGVSWVRLCLLSSADDTAATVAHRPAELGCSCCCCKWFIDSLVVYVHGSCVTSKQCNS